MGNNAMNALYTQRRKNTDNLHQASDFNSEACKTQAPMRLETTCFWESEGAIQQNLKLDRRITMGFIWNFEQSLNLGECSARPGLLAFYLTRMPNIDLYQRQNY